MPTKVKKVVDKKVAPKKVVKKVAAKKAVAKKATKGRSKELVFADNQSSFWVKNGEILNSLVALSSALEKMEKAVFAHHVNKNRNDFADWVRDVLKDNECANDLRKAKSSAGAKIVVVKHLKVYSV
jgi:hypothetical protein